MTLSFDKPESWQAYELPEDSEPHGKQLALARPQACFDLVPADGFPPAAEIVVTFWRKKELLNNILSFTDAATRTRSLEGTLDIIERKNVTVNGNTAVLLVGRVSPNSLYGYLVPRTRIFGYVTVEHERGVFEFQLSSPEVILQNSLEILGRLITSFTTDG